MLKKCLYHGLEDWLPWQIFYNGLDGNIRFTLDGASAEVFMNNEYNEGCLFIEMTIAYWNDENI